MSYLELTGFYQHAIAVTKLEKVNTTEEVIEVYVIPLVEVAGLIYLLANEVEYL